MTQFKLMHYFDGQNLKKFRKSFMVKKVEREENLKFPLAFGGECKADFEATLVQAKMHRAQALLNQNKQFEVLEKL